MNKARLQKWANGLRKVNPNNFNIRAWVNGEYDELELVQEHACGTTACAAGYLPLIFPRSWKINETKYPVLKAAEYEEAGQGHHPDEALTHWFEISYYQAGQIIYESKYDKPPRDITPSDVADRIEEIIAEG